MVNVIEGGSITLACKAYGYPGPITISWKFEGKHIGNVGICGLTVQMNFVSNL